MIYSTKPIDTENLNDSYIEADLNSSLKLALLKEKWDHILLILICKKEPLSEEQLTTLTPYVRKIFSTQNLKSDFLSKDDSTKISNKIAPQFQKRNTELKKSSPEIKDARAKKIIEQFALMIDIDTQHRDLKARDGALQFNSQLKEWLADAVKIPKMDPVYLIMETILLLGDKGAPALKGKKHKYPSVQLIPSKIHFNSPKAENSLGVYKNKSGIHLSGIRLEISGDDPNIDLFLTFMHEKMHELCLRINPRQNATPIPVKEWEDLLDSLKQDLNDIKTLPKNYQIFDEIFLYKTKKQVNELPPRILEFFIKNFSLPSDPDIFSPGTIRKFEQLFSLLCQNIAAYKKQLLKIQYESRYPGRFELFDQLKKGQLDKFSKVVTPENYKAYGFMLHSDIKAITYYEKHGKNGFLWNSTDKFGRTFLEAAALAQRFDAVLYWLDKLRQSGAPIPASFNVNMTHLDGKTLLMHAILSQQSKELIYWLVNDCKADVNLKDSSDKTALRYALETDADSEVVDFLTSKLSSRVEEKPTFETPTSTAPAIVETSTSTAPAIVDSSSTAVRASTTLDPVTDAAPMPPAPSSMPSATSSQQDGADSKLDGRFYIIVTIPIGLTHTPNIIWGAAEYTKLTFVSKYRFSYSSNAFKIYTNAEEAQKDVFGSGRVVCFRCPSNRSVTAADIIKDNMLLEEPEKTSQPSAHLQPSS